MESSRFELEKYVSGGRNRYSCPQCGHKKEFTRYVDQSRQITLPDHVGICNKANSCGYHYKPSEWLKESGMPMQQAPVAKPAATAPPSLLPYSLVKGSLANVKNSPNHFMQWLEACFGAEIARWLQNEYSIGTSKHWKGACVFWQIDFSGNARAGKVMLYDQNTGKRVKHPYSHIHWVHALLKLEDFNLTQCFFGEHLLRAYPNLPVAIVESEATAIAMCGLSKAGLLPSYIWLATGGCNGCKWSDPSVASVLKGRNVLLYPDLGFFDKWKKKAECLKALGISVQISALLEDKAPASHKEKGNYDLRDYFVEAYCDEQFGCFIGDKGYPISWD